MFSLFWNSEAQFLMFWFIASYNKFGIIRFNFLREKTIKKGVVFLCFCFFFGFLVFLGFGVIYFCGFYGLNPSLNMMVLLIGSQEPAASTGLPSSLSANTEFSGSRM